MTHRWEDLVDSELLNELLRGHAEISGLFDYRLKEFRSMPLPASCWRIVLAEHFGLEVSARMQCSTATHATSHVSVLFPRLAIHPQ